MSQRGCSGSALSAGDLAASIARSNSSAGSRSSGQTGSAPGGASRGSALPPSTSSQGTTSLASAVADVSSTNRGIAGQAELVVGEMRDSATRDNISSRRSAPLLTGPRMEGLRNRLFLKYVCADYEFFNTSDQVFR